LTVERARPGERCRERAGGGAARLGSVGMGGLGTTNGLILPEVGDVAWHWNPKCWKRLGGVPLSMLKLSAHDRRSRCVFFLISLANRFNSAYDLLLHNRDWSGGETSKVRLTLS